MFLCSLARNPDGSFVRPTIYEINHAQVMELLWPTVAVVAVGLILAAVQWRRPASRIVGAVTAFVLAMHPLWTVPTNGGDCGELQVDCSWIVLGMESMLGGAQLLILVWRSDRGNPVRDDYDDRRVWDA